MKGRHATYSRIFAILLLILLWGGGTEKVKADDLEKNRQELLKLQQRITETAKMLKGKQGEETDLLSDLDAMDRQIRKISGRVALARRKLKELETRQTSQKKALAEIEKEIGKMDGRVKKRLSALYKSGELGLLRVLFAESSPAVMAEEYDFLGRVIRHDRELLTEYRGNLLRQSELLASLEGLASQQQATVSRQRKEQGALDNARKLKKEVLAQVRNDRQVLAGSLQELKDRARRIGGLVKKLESDHTRAYTGKTGDFAALKGHLPWPVNGRVKVGFGTNRHAQLGTQFESQGFEIKVPVETGIKTVASGKVIFANSFKGFGKLLIIDHGDNYYTLYAQAARLARKVGDEVDSGDVIAYSGFDGRDYVYFEIRHRGTPQNPQTWLRSRR